MNKQVIVIGMHRSGTSTIALILQKLGVNMGDSLLGASSSNPYGHAEDYDFLELHESMLKDTDGTWDFPPKQIKLNRVFNKYKYTVNSLIDNKNTKEIWGWKEPRTVLFLKNYHELLDNPYYVCVNRDDLEVAKSLKKRNRMPIKKGIKLSKRYKGDLNDFLLSCNPNRVLYLNYNDLHNSKYNIVGKLVDFLEIKSDQEQTKSANEIVRPLNDVRDNRVKLKKNENRENYKKALRHPVKAIKFMYKRCWRLFKYHLGV